MVGDAAGGVQQSAWWLAVLLAASVSGARRFVLASAMASASSSSSSSSRPRAGDAAESPPSWRSVRQIDLRGAAQEGEIAAAFASAFERTPEIASYNARDDPRSAAKAVAASLAFVTKALPAAVVAELSEFPFDPAAPVALVLRGLALPESVPPTPRISTIHGLEDREHQVRVPLAEAWALGIGRLLGHPFVPPFFDAGHRGGLVRDMVPVPGIDNLCGLLEMHRDFPAAVFAPFPEPETFLLVCVRGDPRRRAQTLIVDSGVLLAALDTEVVRLLSTHAMQVEIVEPPEAGGAVHKQGAPFYAISAAPAAASSRSQVAAPPTTTGVSAAAVPDTPQVTLFVPDAGAFAAGSVGRVVSPTGGADAERAWRTMMDAALRLCDRVDLQAGDCLVLNNVRCCHGRTAFEPTGDGADRWLVKTYVTSSLWTRPGVGHGDEAAAKAGAALPATLVPPCGRVAYPASVLRLDTAS